jgi:hypothetical protein
MQVHAELLSLLDRDRPGVDPAAALAQLMGTDKHTPPGTPPMEGPGFTRHLSLASGQARAAVVVSCPFLHAHAAHCRK